jgi:predicted Zn-dependent protease
MRFFVLLLAACVMRTDAPPTTDLLRELTARASEDLSLQAHVEAVGLRVAAASDAPHHPWQFLVLDDAEVNAFALPPAHVFVTRGLLYLGSDAELAVVLGHEMGHITARHAEKKREQEQRASMPVSVGVGPSWVGALIRAASIVAQQVIISQYPKVMELEADELGFRSATQAGYDGREGITLMRTYERIGTDVAQGWFATHPHPKLRIVALSHAARGQVWSGHTIDRAPYMQALEGTAYGDDPRQGYLDGAVFRHPALRFELDLPEGGAHIWKNGTLVSANASGVLLRLTIVPHQDAEHVRQQHKPTLPHAAFFSRYGRTLQIESAAPVNIRFTVTKPDPASPRVHVVSLEEAMTLARFAEAHPSVVPLSTLEALNGRAATEVMPAGTLVKRVEVRER